MTKKRIRQIAAKMWAKCANFPAEEFGRLADIHQQMWISAAKVAVAEITSKPKSVDGTLGKICRIDKQGKRTCK